MNTYYNNELINELARDAGYVVEGNMFVNHLKQRAFPIPSTTKPTPAPASESREVDDYDLNKLYDWIMDENRKPATTSFTSSVARNIAKEIEFRLSTAQPVKSDPQPDKPDEGSRRVSVKELKEIKDAFNWTWENMATPHTSDHFNIPANGIHQLELLIETNSAPTDNGKEAKEDDLWEELEIEICRYSNVDDISLFSADINKVMNKLKQSFTITRKHQ